MPLRMIAALIVALLATETARAQGCESVVCVQPAQYLVVYEAEALHAMSTADLSSLLAPHSTGRLVLGGVIGWSVGAVAGGLLGYMIQNGNVSEFAPGWQIAVGVVLGSSFGAPFGVNLANGGAGNAPLTLLTSFGVLAAGGYLASRADGATTSTAILIAIPLAQIGTSVAIQRATTRGR